MTNRTTTPRTRAPDPYQPNNIVAIQAGVAMGARPVLPSLGSKAKSALILDRIDPETGEVFEVKKSDSPYDKHKAPAERLHLQDVAAKLLPDHRVAKCGRALNGRQGAGVEVLQRVAGEQGFFAGLQTCASVWCCPICAAKVSERRRQELKAAMEQHKAAGGCIDLLTLTIRHDRHDKLADLLRKLAKALSSFTAHYGVRAIFQEMGVIGAVRGLEVTHGRRSEVNNAWHPHIHALQFAGVGVDLVDHTPAQRLVWQNRLYDYWAGACVTAGLKPPSREHGVDLAGGDKAGAYVTKMGLEASKWDYSHELTKANSKRAKTGEGPFDLLRSIDADDTDRQAKALFIEYAAAFHGKRQLYWSPGLKKRYAVADLTDEEIEAQKEEKATILGIILKPAWKDVLACQGRGTVLRLAIYGWPAIESYLKTIQGRAGRPVEATRTTPDTPQPPS